jgi:hypothetical protein
MEIFWANVDYFRAEKQYSWYEMEKELKIGSFKKYFDDKKNISLKTIEKIADFLEIDDYVLLFEDI